MRRDPRRIPIPSLAAAVASLLLAAGALAAPEDGTRMTHELAEEFWQEFLASEPVEATILGFRAHDGRMPDPSPAATRARRKRLSRMLERLRRIDPQGLPSPERVTWWALEEEIDGRIARIDCDVDAWDLDALAGPQVALLQLPALQPVATVAQGRALVQRYRAIGPYLDARAANLRTALSEDRVAAHAPADRVSRQLDALLARPTAEWELMDPVRAEHPDWEAADLGRFRADLARAVRESIRPAFERLASLVTREILPRARPDQQAGISHVPGGMECYARLIRVHAGVERPPQEIHELGRREIARIRAEMERLGSRALGTSGLDAVLARLRDDPALRFRTRDEIEAAARRALERAQEALPRLLGRLPSTGCAVQRVEAYEEADSTIAYYRQPAADGSRSGVYFVNTYAPGTRPRYEAEALAFHESVPGHHVQISLAQEQADLPEFRRHLGSTALVEGWALYAERLADEIGLYSSDLDRLGMLSFDAWRASRLVVDTGLHALGWSRQQAIDYLRANTALAENNIANEVDRYITWPAQALAYKIGQTEILALRAGAEERQGDSFDLRAFHDALLSHGAVGLPVLRRILEP